MSSRCSTLQLIQRTFSKAKCSSNSQTPSSSSSSRRTRSFSLNSAVMLSRVRKPHKTQRSMSLSRPSQMPKKALRTMWSELMQQGKCKCSIGPDTQSVRSQKPKVQKLGRCQPCSLNTLLWPHPINRPRNKESKERGSLAYRAGSLLPKLL